MSSQRILVSSQRKNEVLALGKNPVKWRRRWDSNPRAREGKRISSAPRYDRFDTSPNIKFLYVKPSNLTKHKIKAKFRAKQSETAEI